MRAGAMAITGCALSFNCGFRASGLSFASLSGFCADGAATIVAASSRDAAPAHALRRKWFMVHPFDLSDLDPRSAVAGLVKLYKGDRTTASASVIITGCLQLLPRCLLPAWAVR